MDTLSFELTIKNSLRMKAVFIKSTSKISPLTIHYSPIDPLTH